MDITEILTVILIASASALCIALIYYLNQIVKSVQAINSNINALSSEIKPFIKSTLELSDSLNQITNETKSQLQISGSIISDFRERVDKILDVENKVRSGIENAVMPFVQNLNAIGKGVETFWRNFKNK
jgi:archaellum component FlaC